MDEKIITTTLIIAMMQVYLVDLMQTCLPQKVLII
jgi:hypothetical protein